MGSPVGAMGSPVGAMGRPVGAMGRPVGAMGRPVGAMGRPVGAMGRPVGAMGRPVGAGTSRDPTICGVGWQAIGPFGVRGAITAFRASEQTSGVRRAKRPSGRKKAAIPCRTGTHRGSAVAGLWRASRFFFCFSFAVRLGKPRSILGCARFLSHPYGATGKKTRSPGPRLGKSHSVMRFTDHCSLLTGYRSRVSRDRGRPG
jgi:hypothetical protein